jgi:hypothetical protein
MSAAKAAVDIKAAPAASNNLTLRIGFVLLAVRQTRKSLTSKNPQRDDATKNLSAT